MPTGPQTHIVRRLRASIEPAASFAVDRTGTLGNFIDIPMAEDSGSWEVHRDPQNPIPSLQDVRNYQLEVIGRDHWSLSFSVALAPTGSAAAASAAAAQGPVGRLLRVIMGGEFLGEGSAASALWSSPSTGGVTSGAGFRPGGVAVWVDGSGVAHPRPIKQVDGNTLTLKVAFPAAPANTNPIYSGASYYIGKDPKETLQFIVQGEHDDDRWVLLGGQGTMSFELGLEGEIQMIAFELSGPKWLRAADAAGAANLAGSAAPIGDATYTNWEPITGHQGELLSRTVGVATLTGAIVPVASLEYEYGMEYAQVPSPSGVNGVLRHRLVRSSGTPPIGGSFARFFDGLADFDARDDREPRLLWYRNGVVAGEQIVLDAPKVQFVEVGLEATGEMAGQQVTWRGRNDTDTVLPSSPTAATVELASSPFRIHLA